MTRIMFWNVHRNPNIDYILQDVILEKECNILILAEYNNNLTSFCNKLSVQNKDFYEVPIIGCKRIKIIAEKNYSAEIISDSQYYTIHNFNFIGKQLLIASLHFPSKLHASSDDTIAISSRMINDVSEAESRINHNNTIIIGDFNANPFEEICINANCFHAISSAKEVEHIERTVNSYKYKMLYNPMWNFFGDYNKPEGTYFKTNTGIKTYFWNIFDQVLLRPSMLNSFKADSLQIIHNINGNSLLNKRGVPDINKYSDHLPIFFEIMEEKLNG